MSRFIFDITEAQREKLELHRQAFGLRSLADAVRDLIDRRAGSPVRMPSAAGPEKVVDIGPPIDPATPRTVKGVVRPAKSEPFKTRLKGEWKAP